MTIDQIQTMAKKLAKLNFDVEETIQEILWFPNDEEIRLIEIDALTIPCEEAIHPFYFGPDPAREILLPSAIAMITPEDREKLEPPLEWGDWKAAVSFRRESVAA